MLAVVPRIHARTTAQGSRTATIRAMLFGRPSSCLLPISILYSRCLAERADGQLGTTLSRTGGSMASQVT